MRDGKLKKKQKTTKLDMGVFLKVSGVAATSPAQRATGFVAALAAERLD